jgi:alginate O-acetyltransferase complex protein AlgJ
MQKLLVVAFLAIIALPAGGLLVGYNGGNPRGENRELAAFPHLGRSPGSLVAFAGGLKSWFGDHFGLRATLIRWHGETHLRGLDESPSESVLKGEDDWLFYATDFAVEDYVHANPFTSDDLANWRAAVVDAAKWLRVRRMPYLIFVAPDKHVLYPEEMPRTIVPINDLSRTDQWYTALQDTGLTIDVRPALFSAKARERLYQRTDTHWNDRGAFVAYQQIIGAVRARVPGVPPAWTRDDFDAATRETEAGDLAGMIGLKDVLREEDLALVPKRPRRAIVIEPHGAKPTDEEGYLVTEIPGSSLPRALVFRDSFVSQLAPFLSEHFSRVVYAWQNDFDAALVEREHPDVVIQEIVGRHLYGFIPSPELVPR